MDDSYTIGIDIAKKGSEYSAISIICQDCMTITHLKTFKAGAECRIDLPKKCPHCGASNDNRREEGKGEGL